MRNAAEHYATTAGTGSELAAGRVKHGGRYCRLQRPDGDSPGAPVL